MREWALSIRLICPEIEAVQRSIKAENCIIIVAPMRMGILCWSYSFAMLSASIEGEIGGRNPIEIKDDTSAKMKMGPAHANVLLKFVVMSLIQFR